MNTMHFAPLAHIKQSDPLAKLFNDFLSTLRPAARLSTPPQTLSDRLDQARDEAATAAAVRWQSLQGVTQSLHAIHAAYTGALAVLDAHADNPAACKAGLAPYFEGAGELIGVSSSVDLSPFKSWSLWRCELTNRSAFRTIAKRAEKRGEVEKGMQQHPKRAFVIQATCDALDEGFMLRRLYDHLDEPGYPQELHKRLGDFVHGPGWANPPLPPMMGI